MCASTTAIAVDQNIVVVLDDSGSMKDRMRTDQGRVQRIDAAKQALTAVLSQLPPETKVGVLTLNNRVNGSHWVVPFGPVDSSQLLQNIRRIRAEGGTPLGEFLKQGADQLLEARGQQVYGSYRLLVVTDGEANDARLLDAYLPDILSRGLLVDVIGVDLKSDHSLATRVHNYRRADDPQALEKAISEGFAETSTDDQDAAADFEMLAALPEGFAEQALASLAKSGNTPIRARSADGQQVDVSLTGSSASSSTTVSTAFGGLLCCFATFAILIIVASIILGGRRR